MIREVFFHWFLFNQLRTGYFLLDLAVFNLLLTYAIVSSTSLQVSFRRYTPNNYLTHTLYFSYGLYHKITTFYFHATRLVLDFTLNNCPSPAVRETLLDYKATYNNYITSRKEALQQLLFQSNSYPSYNVRAYFIALTLCKDAVDYYGLDADQLSALLDKAKGCLGALKAIVHIKKTNEEIARTEAIDSDILKNLQAVASE